MLIVIPCCVLRIVVSEKQSNASHIGTTELLSYLQAHLLRLRLRFMLCLHVYRPDELRTILKRFKSLKETKNRQAANNKRRNTYTHQSDEDSKRIECASKGTVTPRQPEMEIRRDMFGSQRPLELSDFGEKNYLQKNCYNSIIF